VAAEVFFRYHFDVYDCELRSVRYRERSSRDDNRNIRGTYEVSGCERSVVLAGHKTSVSLEDAFWNSLKEIAGSGNMNLSDLITAIDSVRHKGNISSAIHLFVLDFYRKQLFDRLDVRDKRQAIQGLISASARKAPKTPRSSSA
jgi:predicted DNA-binding ribbon-helix-helix protein